MKFALHVPNFSWGGGSAELGQRLATLAQTAEDAGYSYLSVMDHFFQIDRNGSAEEPMLAAYTALGFIAGKTSKIHIGTLVSGVTYRHPALLVKEVTTLDVVSGGRAFFGIGAAWYEREHIGLGVRFPPVSERFERLEETLQIADRMFKGDMTPYKGKYYEVPEPINSPALVSSPRPMVMIGGSGEKKTLKLVARYADACNINAADRPGLQHKLDVLQEHCEMEGRNYDEIEKTTSIGLTSSEPFNSSDVIKECEELAEMGFDTVFTRAVGSGDRVAMVEKIGKEIIPNVAGL